MEELKASLAKPNVVRFHEVFEDPTSTFLVMELVSGGDFMQYVTQRGFLNEGEAQWFFRQMVGVL